MTGYKNLCAEIPEVLHGKVREKQAESGQTLSQYMTHHHILRNGGKSSYE